MAILWVLLVCLQCANARSRIWVSIENTTLCTMIHPIQWPKMIISMTFNDGCCAIPFSFLYGSNLLNYCC